ncbi:MAG: gamma-glutamyltransferase, partial [Brevundimonas sp.]|nr:gamma-glutamyltransferase [Brevundimonas sp.]
MRPSPSSLPSAALRSLIALVAGAGLALAGCAGGAGTTAGATAPGPVAAAPQARGPFVAAANPLAVEAGMKVLRRGGSAVDA